MQWAYSIFKLLQVDLRFWFERAPKFGVAFIHCFVIPQTRVLIYWRNNRNRQQHRGVGLLQTYAGLTATHPRPSRWFTVCRHYNCRQGIVMHFHPLKYTTISNLYWSSMVFVGGPIIVGGPIQFGLCFPVYTVRYAKCDNRSKMIFTVAQLCPQI